MDNVDRGNEYATQMVDQGVANRVRYHGISRHECIDCDEPIPEARRQAIAGCTRCTDCQNIHDRRNEQQR